jgi:hypothetical protein
VKSRIERKSLHATRGTSSSARIEAPMLPLWAARLDAAG